MYERVWEQISENESISFFYIYLTDLLLELCTLLKMLIHKVVLGCKDRKLTKTTDTNYVILCVVHNEYIWVHTRLHRPSPIS